jgi:hypothetical protein
MVTEEFLKSPSGAGLQVLHQQPAVYASASSAKLGWEVRITATEISQT